MYTLVLAARLLEDHVEGALEAIGLSAAKLMVLHQIANAERPMSLSELAELAKCVRSNMTQLVDRLERDGLVQRQSDPEDRRGILVALTPMGEQREAEGLRIKQDLQDEFATLVSADDRAAIARVLVALQNAYTTSTATPHSL